MGNKKALREHDVCINVDRGHWRTFYLCSGRKLNGPIEIIRF